jgi:glutaminase
VKDKTKGLGFHFLPFMTGHDFVNRRFAMQELLERLVQKNLPHTRKGRCAQYIPALKEQNPHLLGISVVTLDQKLYRAGAFPEYFTLQSISKVIALIVAIMERGKGEIFSKVGMEPTGDPFNSIYKMEIFSYEKPLNPMINAGRWWSLP